MDKEESKLVYELAVKIFVKSVTNKDDYPDDYEAVHMANWSIEKARLFVEEAKNRGLVKTRPGLFDILAGGAQ